MGGLEGVIRTRVGYTGGSTKHPTYYNLADHTETVQLDFDPAKVTYEALVETFFASHNATRQAMKRQYMSAIFVHDEEQATVAHSVMQRWQESSRASIQTLVMPAADFYLAEDYHQKYALQRDRVLMGEYRAIYPDIWDLVASTAATHVNAYLYGCGSGDRLRAELDRLGLSEAARPGC